MEAAKKRWPFSKKPGIPAPFKTVELKEFPIKALEESADPVTQRLLESYSWLNEAAIRALKDTVFPSGQEGKLGQGAAGSAFEVTYNSKKYVLKISVDMPWIPFSPREGMIGAYLFAPQLPVYAQRRIAVPEYRLPDVKNDLDPYLHVVDYKGMWVTRLEDAERAFKSITKSNNPGVVIDFLRTLGKSHKKKTIVLFQFLEHFEGGDLYKWTWRQFSYVNWITHPQHGLDVLRRYLHYMEVAFYQLSLTIDSMASIGAVQADVHGGNVFVTYLPADLSRFVFLRDRENGTRDFFDGRKPDHPSVKDGVSGPDDVPLFALGDLGTSVLYPFGVVDFPLTIFPHQTQDLSMLALGLMAVIVMTANTVPSLPIDHLKTLPRDALLATMGFYIEAYYLLAKFSTTMSHFWIPTGPWKPKSEGGSGMNTPHELFGSRGGDAYMVQLGKLNDLIELWDKRGRDWIDLFSDREKMDRVRTDPVFFKSVRDAWLDPTVPKDMDKRKSDFEDNTKGHPGHRFFQVINSARFTHSTNWGRAAEIRALQKAMIYGGIAVPRGFEVVSEMKLEEIVAMNGLKRPVFREGDEAFWKTRPSSAKMGKPTEAESEGGYEDLFS